MHKPVVHVDDKNQGACLTTASGDTIAIYVASGINICRYPKGKTFPDLALALPEAGNAYIQTGTSTRDFEHRDIDAEKAAAILSKALESLLAQ